MPATPDQPAAIDATAPEAAQRRIAQLLADNAALRLTLRQSRHNQHRAARLATRRSTAQADQIRCLEGLLQATRERLATLESGQAMIELGRRLLQLSEINDQLTEAAHRVWYRDKTLCAAHAECERLSRERDALASRARPGPARRGAARNRPTSPVRRTAFNSQP